MRAGVGRAGRSVILGVDRADGRERAPEMVRLADRIVVTHAGRITGEIENNHEYAAVRQPIMSFIH
jgi:ABC-type sugar transport system ATPase subunit